jgi:hypothetical protein
MAAACLASVVGIAAGAQTPDPTRGLIRVAAPVGPNGAVRELYTASFALLVGVSQYDQESVWRRLGSIPDELAAVATTLKEVGFGHIEQVVNPTGKELRDRVGDFIENHGQTEGHRLLFYFSGHGYTLDKGERGYFLPRDAPDPAVNEASFRRIAVPMDLVVFWAGDFKARHALFVFDSCFSGTIFSTRSRAIPQRISDLTARPVREFLAAGDADQAVPAKSVFTPLFTTGLKGAADLDRDGFITGTELGNYVQAEVLKYRTSQTPQFGKLMDPAFNKGDIVFAVPGATGTTVSEPERTAEPPETTEVARPLQAGAGSREAIVSVLAAYRNAYEAMDVDALRQVFPTFGNFDALRKSFADFRSIAVTLNPGSAQVSIRPDGSAVAIAMYSVTFTGKTGRLDTFPKRATNAHFQLRRTGSGWIIEKIDYK